MTSEYEEIFARRGHSYDAAMQKYPRARDSEFENLFNACTPAPLSTVLDLPSGGGYLNRHLPAGCLIESAEPSDQFSNTIHLTREVDLENLQLKSDYFDVLICLAASHHIENKQGLFHSAFQALNRGGHFLLGDVLSGSPIAEYLDGFTSQYNGTGHDGDYLTIELCEKLASEAGFTIVDVKEYPCPWSFNDTEELAEFSCLLFGMKNVCKQRLLDTLNDKIGISKTADGVQLDWRLLYLTAQRP